MHNTVRFGAPASSRAPGAPPLHVWDGGVVAESTTHESTRTWAMWSPSGIDPHVGVEKTPKVGAQGARRGRGESAHEAASGVKAGEGWRFRVGCEQGFPHGSFQIRLDQWFGCFRICFVSRQGGPNPAQEAAGAGAHRAQTGIHDGSDPQR